LPQSTALRLSADHLATALLRLQADECPFGDNALKSITSVRQHRDFVAMRAGAEALQKPVPGLANA